LGHHLLEIEYLLIIPQTKNPTNVGLNAVR